MHQLLLLVKVLKIDITIAVSEYPIKPTLALKDVNNKSNSRNFK